MPWPRASDPVTRGHLLLDPPASCPFSSQSLHSWTSTWTTTRLSPVSSSILTFANHFLATLFIRI